MPSLTRHQSLFQITRRAVGDSDLSRHRSIAAVTMDAWLTID